MKKKICVVVNSRANYARIKSFLYAVKKSKKFKLQLLTGASASLSRFGNLEKIIKQDKFTILKRIYSIVDGENLETMAKSTGLSLIELSGIFADIKPDMVVVIADRFENLATAIAASYMNIPVIHTQGGEVTGSIDESIRHSITKLSHVHFPSTKSAYKNVIKMGEHPKTVFNTGCHSMDLAYNVLKDKNKAIDFNKKYYGIGSEIDFSKPYLVVMQHPVTTEYSLNNDYIKNTFDAVKMTNMQTVWLWPNIDAGASQISKSLRTYREKGLIKNIRFFKNFEPEDYLRLIINCKCLIGNSSSAIREGSFLGIPAVNIGNRQKGREHGKNILHAVNKTKNIYSTIIKQINKKYIKPEKIFGDGKTAKKMLDILTKINININKKLYYGNHK